MAHIVFLVGSYYPYFSAVGTCCFNIAEDMAKDNKVTVVCMKSRFDQSEKEEYQGQTIVRVSHKRWDMRLKLYEKIKTNSGIIKKWYTLLLNMLCAGEYLKIIFSRISLNMEWVKSYQRALYDIKDPIDVIIPFCFPMEAVVAGVEYKKTVSEIVFIPYLFDQFAEGKEIHKLKILMFLKMQRHLNLEEAIIDLSDKILVIHSQKNHFTKYFPESINKLKFVEHPLLKLIDFRSSNKRTNDDPEECLLVFTGNFLKGYVMPDYMLNLLLLVKQKMNFALHLYVGGNCQSVIEKYQRLMPNVITNYGYVDKETVLEAITKSDILISVAEIKGIQVSSKIFEYMSAGKPIVHFYTADNDINVRILKEYPLCLCLKQNVNLQQENIDKFVNFCIANKAKTLDFNEVERIYYYATPKFIADQMRGIIDITKKQRN